MHTLTRLLAQGSGAAYVGARVGPGSYPGGVFFSVSVDQQSWILSNNVNVENVDIALASQEFSVVSDTWYNLTLFVDGIKASAWIDGEQVIDGFVLPSINVGWAAIGTSVQTNNSYTIAQFDDFSVSAQEGQCAYPEAGDRASLLWCGGTS